MSDTTSQLAENKLIILYLINKMGLSLSNSELCQFALEKELMDYFSLQLYLSELVEATYLEKTKDHHTTRYLITEEGSNVLSFFISHISDVNKKLINVYVTENSQRIRSEYEVSANYFEELSGEFLVKCGVFSSDGTSLMEISLVVVTKNQAKIICNNWIKNVNSLYNSILTTLAVNEPIETKNIEVNSELDCSLLDEENIE